MKKTVSGMILTLLLIGISMLAFTIQRVGSSEPPATEWIRTYGGADPDGARSVVQTSDGEYVIAGSTWSFGAGGGDFWLVKADSSGIMQWSKAYGGESDEVPGCMIQTSDGGYAIVGRTESFGAGKNDFWLVKTDTDGNMQWDQTYGGTNNDDGMSVVQTSDGGYVLVGYTESFGAGGYDVWLVKTDAIGNMQWSKTFGGSSMDDARSMVQTDDGGYAIVGWTHSFGLGGRDLWLIKTNPTGNIEWHETYGGTGWDEGYSVIQTDDGGYAIAGHTTSFGAQGWDFWLLRTNSAGETQWNQVFGGDYDDYAHCVLQTVDSGYVITGDTQVSPVGGSFDGWLIKTDVDGNVQWNRIFAGLRRDSLGSVIETVDGGYALAGATGAPTGSEAGYSDFWLIKLASLKISATIDVDPDTLNVKSNGEWITAYITLPEGYNAEDIDPETVKIGDIQAAWSEIQDGVFMAKFDRVTIRETLTGMIDYEEGTKFYDLELTVTGEVGGTPFEGTDTMVVIWK